LIRIDGRTLTLEALERAARTRAESRLDPEAAARMRDSRAVVERALTRGAPVYGVNTGFGELKDRRVRDEDLARLQLNLLRSHAAGVGPALPADVVRALGLLRANSLAVGVSGVRPALVEHLLEVLAQDVVPVVPAQGSVGASGDLAPLAHFALVLVGEGEATFGGQVKSGAEALAAARLEPFVLAPKEGLALINGTQLSTAVLGLVLVDAGRLLRAAIGACALSLEALLGSTRASTRGSWRCGRTPGRAWSRRGCAAWSRAAGSWPRTPTARASRIRTRFAAPRRCWARATTRSPTPARWSSARSTRRPTTRSSLSATAPATT
jgi:histidine ammonia-lyase